MNRKILIGLVWLGFIVYILVFAPPSRPSTVKLLKNLFTGNWGEINAIILALFALIGIWIQIYCGLILADGRMQKVPAWPFVLASVATGVIGLMPYLALRDSNQVFSGQKDALLKLVDSRLFGLAMSLSAIALLAYALLFGDWGDFIYQFKTNRFINGMSLAFCLFCALFPTLLGDDMARRGLKDSPLFWLVALLPLVGSSVYLCLRPALPESGEASSSLVS